MSMTEQAQVARSADEVIGERVHQLMWRAHMTQTTLAPLLGLTQSGLSPKLRGRKKWQANELRILARHFGVSLDYLFGEDERPMVGPAGIEPTTSTV